MRKPLIVAAPGFNYNGVIYADEMQAVNQAITDIGKTLIKEHASDPYQGIMRHHGDLLELLTRYRELNNVPVFPTPASHETVELKVDRATLDAGRHITGCRARATGLLSRCSCNQDSTI